MFDAERGRGRLNARECKVPEGYELEHFVLSSGDFSPTSELIGEAFYESYKYEGATFTFTPETFEIIFGSPIVKRDLFLRIRHLESGNIVGFLGAIPRTLKFPDGNKYEYCCATCLSVRTDHQRQGLATCMFVRGLEIIEESKYDGAYGFFHVEHHSKTAAKKVLGDSLKRVYTIKKFMVRILDVDRVSKTLKLKWYEKLYFKFKSNLKKSQMDDVRTLEYGDIPKLYELTKDFEKKNDISIVTNRKDFEWYMKLPYVTTLVHNGKDGTPDGFISAWPFKLAGFGSTCNMGMIDIVHIYNLDMTAASNLTARLCLETSEKGWAGLQKPFIPYFDAKPFLKSGFTMLHASHIRANEEVVMLSLSGHEIPRVKSLYLDFR